MLATICSSVAATTGSSSMMYLAMIIPTSWLAAMAAR